MIKVTCQHICLLLSGAIALGMVGCITPNPGPTSRFYQLQPVFNNAPVDQKPDAPVVRLGPVQVADYLNRPQIVTRTSDHEVSYDELMRWAEPLQNNILSAVAENLAATLPAVRVIPFSSLPMPDATVSVPVEITRFEVRNGGEILLQSRWTVVSRDLSLPPQSGSIRIARSAASSNMEDTLAMQSVLLGELSRKIADDLRAVLGDEGR